jgi:hypothetical protein
MSTFTQRLARIAEDQYNKYHLQHEHDPQLSKQIQKYWADLGLNFPGVNTPWSAVFVSWCVKSAGATAQDFKFSAQHSVFVNWAINEAAKLALITGRLDGRQWFLRILSHDQVSPCLQNEPLAGRKLARNWHVQRAGVDPIF